MTIALNSLSGKLLISISLRVFPWGFVLFFHLELIPLSSHFFFFLTFSFYLYEIR